MNDFFDWLNASYLRTRAMFVAFFISGIVAATIAVLSAVLLTHHGSRHLSHTAAVAWTLICLGIFVGLFTAIHQHLAKRYFGPYAAMPLSWYEMRYRNGWMSPAQAQDYWNYRCWLAQQQAEAERQQYPWRY